MKDSDSKKLENLYEAMDGGSYPQYGSQYSISTPVIGTEELRSGYVDVPEDAGKESEKDDEDQEGESSLQKILDDLKDTIQRMEDKKKEREADEVDTSLGESVVNEASPLQSVLSKAYSTAKSDPTGGLDTIAGGVLQGAHDLYELAKGRKRVKYVGFGDGEIKPEKNMMIQVPQELTGSSKYVAKVIAVDEKRKTFEVKTVPDKNGKTPKFKVKLVTGGSQQVDQFTVDQNSKYRSWVTTTEKNSIIVGKTSKEDKGLQLFNGQETVIQNRTYTYTKIGNRKFWSDDAGNAVTDKNLIYALHAHAISELKNKIKNAGTPPKAPTSTPPVAPTPRVPSPRPPAGSGVPLRIT
jgi:hypothetical protein